MTGPGNEGRPSVRQHRGRQGVQGARTSPSVSEGGDLQGTPRHRVDKFVWQKLMLVSGLKPETRAVLNALHPFMSADGSNARPGLENLRLVTGRGRTVLSGHLRTAVEAGYLEVTEQGGRRGNEGRATVYAATVPRDVFDRREEILNAPPWSSRRQDAATVRPDAGDLRDPADHSPASDRPDVGNDSQRPADRTMDASQCSADGFPVFGPAAPEFGGSDPIKHLHQVLPIKDVPSAADHTAASAPVGRDREESSSDGSAVAAALHVLREHARPGMEITQEYASRVVRDILDDKPDVRSPERYVRACVSGDPRRYLPVTSPADRTVAEALRRPDGRQAGRSRRAAEHAAAARSALLRVNAS